MKTPGLSIFLLILGCACSSSIPLPAPEELSVKQIADEAMSAVEVSWKLVLKVDGYLLYYDDDGSGEPYEGDGLCLSQWPAGCGDFDGGFAGDGGSVDASQPCMPAQSPVRIPVEWCLEQQQSLSDGGLVPVETPGTRPRVRLQNLVPSTTYYFAVQAFRGDVTSEFSKEAKITIESEPIN